MSNGGRNCFGIARFVQEIAGAAFERQLLFGNSSGEHDYGYVVGIGVLSQAVKDFDAAQARHIVVHEDRVGVRVGGRRQARTAVVCRNYLVAGRLEPYAQPAGKFVVVVDDEYAWRGWLVRFGVHLQTVLFSQFVFLPGRGPCALVIEADFGELLAGTVAIHLHPFGSNAGDELVGFIRRTRTENDPFVCVAADNQIVAAKHMLQKLVDDYRQPGAGAAREGIDLWFDGGNQ